jgi:predicted KAP-like P-loop ATPase
VELSKQKHPDGITRARLFLERLEDYTTEEIPLERIPLIVQALFNIGDQLLLPEDDKCRMFDFGNETRIGRVIYQMLRRLDEQERFSILKKAIENGNALSIIEYEVITYGQAHGKYGVDKPYPEDKWIVSEQHLQELEKITLEKVRFAAQHDLLLQTPKLASILYRWQDWAGEKEVKQWVEKVVSKDESLIVFLEKFLQITFSIASSDVVSRKSYRLNLKQLEHFLDLSKIIERVRKLSKDNWLTANQKNCNQRV